MLMPDGVSLTHARRMLMGGPVPFYLALEREAVAASPADPVWSPPAIYTNVHLHTVLDRAEKRGELPSEPDLARA